jgi:hypothetical protein
LLGFFVICCSTSELQKMLAKHVHGCPSRFEIWPWLTLFQLIEVNLRLGLWVVMGRPDYFPSISFDVSCRLTKQFIRVEIIGRRCLMLRPFIHCQCRNSLQKMKNTGDGETVGVASAPQRIGIFVLFGSIHDRILLLLFGRRPERTTTTDCSTCRLINLLRTPTSHLANIEAPSQPHHVLQSPHDSHLAGRHCLLDCESPI